MCQMSFNTEFQLPMFCTHIHPPSEGLALHATEPSINNIIKFYLSMKLYSKFQVPKSPEAEI